MYRANGGMGALAAILRTDANLYEALYFRGRAGAVVAPSYIRFGCRPGRGQSPVARTEARNVTISEAQALRKVLTNSVAPRDIKGYSE